MKNILDKFINQLSGIFSKLKHFHVLLFIIVIAAIYGFLILRIGNLSSSEPTAQAVNDKLGSVKRPKIDEDAVKKIQQLQETNVEVQSLFTQARDNPFQE